MNLVWLMKSFLGVPMESMGTHGYTKTQYINKAKIKTSHGMSQNPPQKTSKAKPTTIHGSTSNPNHFCRQANLKPSHGVTPIRWGVPLEFMGVPHPPGPRTSNFNKAPSLPKLVGHTVDTVHLTTCEDRVQHFLTRPRDCREVALSDVDTQLPNYSSTGEWHCLPQCGHSLFLEPPAFGP